MTHSRSLVPTVLLLACVVAVVLSLPVAHRYTVKTQVNRDAWAGQAETRAVQVTDFQRGLQAVALVAAGVAVGLALLGGVVLCVAGLRLTRMGYVPPRESRTAYRDAPVLEIAAQGPVMLRYRGGALALDAPREAAIEAAGKEAL